MGFLGKGGAVHLAFVHEDERASMKGKTRKCPRRPVTATFRS